MSESIAFPTTIQDSSTSSPPLSSTSTTSSSSSSAISSPQPRSPTTTTNSTVLNLCNQSFDCHSRVACCVEWKRIAANIDVETRQTTFNDKQQQQHRRHCYWRISWRRWCCVIVDDCSSCINRLARSSSSSSSWQTKRHNRFFRVEKYLSMVDFVFFSLIQFENYRRC